MIHAAISLWLKKSTGHGSIQNVNSRGLSVHSVIVQDVNDHVADMVSRSMQRHSVSQRRFTMDVAGDGAGRTLRSIDQLGNTTVFTHDAAGNQLSVRYPNNVGQDVVYDSLGRAWVHQGTSRESDVS